MSIPVTMYAVVKRPALLGESAALVFQSYVDSISEFDRQLAGSEGDKEIKVDTTCKREAEDADLMDVVEVSSYGTGLKRKRTD